MPKFSHLPTEPELVAACPQIDGVIAAEILRYSAEWSNGNENRQVEIINHLTQMVEHLGANSWHDIVWSYLMNRINNLSNRINDNVKATGEFAQHR